MLKRGKFNGLYAGLQHNKTKKIIPFSVKLKRARMNFYIHPGPRFQCRR